VTRRRGPALVYYDSAGHAHPVDREAVTDPRERALAGRADQLADNADAEPADKPFGFTLTADTTRTGG
jgi:hypothetical protein